MNIKQLIASLQKIHPDFQDEDLIVMGSNENGYTYQLLAGTGIVIKGDRSYVVLTTFDAVRMSAKQGNAVDVNTGKRLTEEDTKLPENETDETE